MTDLFARALVLGVVATAAMDLWAIFLHRVFGIARPNWALIGRWFAHVPRGRLVHDDIAAAPAVERERTIGWIAHYAIGILYALVLLLVVPEGWSRDPTFWPALAVGLVTVGAGWFILQPGMGAGVMARRRANAGQIRLLNIAGHVVFAIGLFAGALLLRG